MGFDFGTLLDIGSAAADIFGNVKKGDESKKIAEQNAEAIRQQAENNKQVSLYDASVAEAQARELYKRNQLELNSFIQQGNAFLGQQKARISKSGVAVGTGSALTVYAKSAYEIQKDVNIIKYNGQSAISRAKSLARRYKILAELGLRDAAAQASIMEETGALAQQESYFKAISSGLNSLSELNQKYNFFGS